MKRYELLYVIDPSDEDGTEDVKRKIEGIITGREGTVISFEKVGKKRLSYPIQKRQYGVYFLVNLNGDGRIVQALDYFLRLSSVILRHIILQLTEKQLKLKELTEKIQQEEAERMRLGGLPQVQPDKAKEVTEPEKILKPVSDDPDSSEEIVEQPSVETLIEPSEEYLTEDGTVKKEVEESGNISPATEVESSDDKTEELNPETKDVDQSNEKTVE